MVSCVPFWLLCHALSPQRTDPKSVVTTNCRQNWVESFLTKVSLLHQPPRFYASDVGQKLEKIQFAVFCSTFFPGSLTSTSKCAFFTQSVHLTCGTIFKPLAVFSDNIINNNSMINVISFVFVTDWCSLALYVSLCCCDCGQKKDIVSPVK